MGTNKGKGCESQFSQIFWHRLILRGQADNLNEIPPPKKRFPAKIPGSTFAGMHWIAIWHSTAWSKSVHFTCITL